MRNPSKFREFGSDQISRIHPVILSLNLPKSPERFETKSLWRNGNIFVFSGKNLFCSLFKSFSRIFHNLLLCLPSSFCWKLTGEKCYQIQSGVKWPKCLGKCLIWEGYMEKARQYHWAALWRRRHVLYRNYSRFAKKQSRNLLQIVCKIGISNTTALDISFFGVCVIVCLIQSF
jgi:hypothetical protein